MLFVVTSAAAAAASASVAAAAAAAATTATVIVLQQWPTLLGKFKKDFLTWLKALLQWNSQKDLTGSFASLCLLLCNPRWLTWVCVTNKSK